MGRTQFGPCGPGKAYDRRIPTMFNAVILNLFAGGSQIQTYDLVRESH